MTAVIKFEYLISPLICTGGQVDDHVNGLRLLKELVSSSNIDVKCEESILNNMHKAGYYPCAKILSKAFPGGDNCVHSAQDVSKIINNIISDIEECSSVVTTHEIEWNSFTVVPPIETISDERKNNVEIFLRDTLSRKFLSSEEFSFFYSQRNKPILQSQKFLLSGTISDIYPTDDMVAPIELTNEIAAHGNLNDFINNIDGYSLYKVANNIPSLKCAFFFGCVNFLNDNFASEKIEWDDFKIGDDFLYSLQRHQGALEQEFSSVVYETVVQVLCRHPKNEVKPFRVSSRSTEQRTHGDLRAFRTHITSRHQALRLMFWVDSNYVITLANIGPKFEGTISLP
ncbi:Uncharacterised protein [Klebsiella pneumoniae]|uniref:hypothetical protein n=1 Tax=Klebsiella pneumoniae TaxID=573 RepID=UPI000E2CD8D3|nr:hypothetical protein [Klebsiella pneumoniae]SWQ88282.1 Uncharacterised protein [Klebsiella pneumoniae]VUH58435.1 Uncharacterised protein [Klebsiella pneumoniae]HCK7137753.1 hypothetical protein [Klebsiella pneumoniae]